MTLLLGVTIAYVSCLHSLRDQFGPLTRLHQQAAPVEDPFKGYTIVPAVWEIEVTPGEGNYVTLNGTIEKVYPELLEINPNYEQEYEEFVAENEAPKSVEKRTDFSTSKYYCNGRWTAISTGEIAKGISYLRRVGGQPRMGAGPGTCARVSCSWNAAIFWCNDVSSGYIMHTSRK